MFKLKKSFVTMAVIVLCMFFVTVILAMNLFSSQVQYTNEREIIERQIHYNAYAGIEKAIYEIKQNKNYENEDYFTLNSQQFESSDTTLNKYYTNLRVTNNNQTNNVYEYTITSTGYGKFKDSIIKEVITAKIDIDYNEKSGIIKLNSIDIQY